MPEHAGGPYTLTVDDNSKTTGSSKVTVDDLLVGDVWFASGQSNMEMPLQGFPGSAVLKDGENEIAHANVPQVRLLLVGQKSSDVPLNDISGSWTQCTPATAAKFSAVAYFFGRELEQKEHVPIGLIDATWGGTPVDSWISLSSLGADASLMPASPTARTLLRTRPDEPDRRQRKARGCCGHRSASGTAKTSLASPPGVVDAGGTLQRHGRASDCVHHQGCDLVSGRDGQRSRARAAVPPPLPRPDLRLARTVEAGELPLSVRADFELSLSRRDLGSRAGCAAPDTERLAGREWPCRST